MTEKKFGRLDWDKLNAANWKRKREKRYNMISEQVKNYLEGLVEEDCEILIRYSYGPGMKKDNVKIRFDPREIVLYLDAYREIEIEIPDKNKTVFMELRSNDEIYAEIKNKIK